MVISVISRLGPVGRKFAVRWLSRLIPLVKSFDSSGAETLSPSIGKKIIWDMEAQGDGYYSGGKIWSPDRDKTYKSKMTLSGSKLAVEGCVMMICRDGGTWSRVN